MSRLASGEGFILCH